MSGRVAPKKERGVEPAQGQAPKPSSEPFVACLVSDGIDALAEGWQLLYTRAVIARRGSATACACLTAVLGLTPWARAESVSVAAGPASASHPRTRPSGLPEHAPALAYELTATLDPDKHQLSGQGTIFWRNTAQRPVREVYFHLYLNAFRDNSTLFLRQKHAGRSGQLPDPEYGSIEIKSLVAREIQHPNLWELSDPHTPDDPEDTTDIRMALPRAVLPGESLTFDVSWEAKLPKIVERTGYSQDFYFLGQWFPKLAKLEPDGTWAHFPFHAQAEFYADFANYRVTLDLPREFIVAATGTQSGSISHAERQQLQYTADWVHDFAWAAWPQFQMLTRQLSGVEVSVFYPPGHRGNAERSLGAVEAALPSFNERYGDYPYPTLSVVHPPGHARRAGGMEYPTLITTGGAWFAHWFTPSVATVTVHELGHQWFYGLVASDERRWPHLDEGLTSYAESEVTHALFGNASGLHLGGLQIAANAYRRAVASERALDDVVAQPAAEFASFFDLGTLVYARVPVLLRTLANVHGHEAMTRALKAYAIEHRFAHPTPESLLTALEQHLGSAAAATAQSTLHARGFVDYVAGPLLLDASPNGNDYRATFVVYRRGNLHFPVKVRLFDSSGKTHDYQLDEIDTKATVSYRGALPLVAASIDPDRAIELDHDWANNSKRVEPAPAPRIWERVVYWFMLLVLGLGA